MNQYYKYLEINESLRNKNRNEKDGIGVDSICHYKILILMITIINVLTVTMQLVVAWNDSTRKCVFIFRHLFISQGSTTKPWKLRINLNDNFQNFRHLSFRFSFFFLKINYIIVWWMSMTFVVFIISLNATTKCRFFRFTFNRNLDQNRTTLTYKLRNYQV